MVRRNGFTVVELALVIMIAAALLTISVRAFGDVGDRRAVLSARTTFQAMHNQARAQAIERGVQVELHLDGNQDSVWIEQADGTVLDGLNFDQAFGVDVRGYNAPHEVLCFSPRGFADEACNSFTGIGAAFFYAGDEVLWAAFLPLGQLVYPDSI